MRVYEFAHSELTREIVRGKFHGRRRFFLSPDCCGSFAIKVSAICMRFAKREIGSAVGRGREEEETRGAGGL